jgi:hypothetical protein
MKNYHRHIVLITDGQVFDVEKIIKIISHIRQHNIGSVHMVGIGNGVSFDMIRRGALEGGGEHIFIRKN